MMPPTKKTIILGLYFLFVAILNTSSVALAIEPSGCGNWLTNALFRDYRVPLQKKKMKLGELTILTSFYLLDSGSDSERRVVAYGDVSGKFSEGRPERMRSVLEIFDKNKKRILRYVFDNTTLSELRFSCSDPGCSYLALKDNDRLYILHRRGPHFERVFRMGNRHHSVFVGLNESNSVTTMKWSPNGTKLAFNMSGTMLPTVNESYVFSTHLGTSKKLAPLEITSTLDSSAPKWSIDSAVVTFFSNGVAYSYNSDSGALIVAP